MKTDKQMKRWLWTFSLLVVLITTIPYLFAFGAQNDEWVFSGFLIGVEDGNSYIAKMLRGAQGDWLFRSPYSAEAQSGTLLYLPYLLLGKALGPDASHLQFIILFHIFRIVSVILLCFASYDFISHFLKSMSARKLALTLAILGGGLGWLLLLLGLPDWLGTLPLDFYSPESFGFLAIFTLPHLTLARAIMLWALLIYLRLNEISPEPLMIALIWLLLAIVHLLSALIGLMVIGLHFLYMQYIFWRSTAKEDVSEKRQRWRHSFTPIIGAAFPIILNLYFLIQDEYLQAWAAQNQIPSPHILHYLIAYAILLPFIFTGANYLKKTNKKSASLLIVWLLALPVLLYLPLGLQRRFAEGTWVVFSVLALAAFESPRFSKIQSWKMIFIAVFPSTLLLLIGATQVASKLSAPIFQSRSEIELFMEIRDVATDSDLVLSSYEIGNMLPAWATVRVLVGHGPESVGLSNFEDDLEALLLGINPAASLASLVRYGPRFLVAESEIANDGAIGIELINRFDDLWLYEINLE